MATPDDALTKYYYICDTQGNIMAVYKLDYPPAALTLQTLSGKKKKFVICGSGERLEYIYGK